MNKEQLDIALQQLLNRITSVALTGKAANSELSDIVSDFRSIIDSYCEITNENNTRYIEASNYARERIGKMKNNDTYITIKSQCQAMIHKLQ